MPNGTDRGRRGAADTAAEAVKWGLRARWLLGCGGCFTGCLWVGAGILGLIILLVLLAYFCHEFLGGAGGWLVNILSTVGLTDDFCSGLQ